MLIIGLNWAGLSAIGRTFAYYLDNEDSNNNLFQAAMLDFSLTNSYVEDWIGMEALSEIEFASVVTKKTGSLNIQYEVNTEKISGDNNFCNALEMKVEHNGVEKHDGSLLSFSAPTTTELGTWEFEIDLPASATNVPHGAECNVDLVFKGWRSDVVSFEESGFTDEERIELRLTSRMIVLNEFLPNPSGLVPDYGFDFGEDNGTMPQGEWVELYNNSDFSYDLAGWYVWDDSGDSANKIEITAANTAPPSTVIGAHDWLVVYTNKEVFDNDGDTVKLFNQNDELIDSHTYTDNDYCEIEPTPGEENTTDTDGSCGGVPPNKSYARIPDGIGYWVDPIPTPGMANKLNEEMVEEPVEELVEEPISDEIEEPVVEEEPIIEEENPPVEEEPSITEEPAPPVEEEPVEEIPVIEEEPTEEEVISEENQEGEGMIEEINEVIDEVIEEIVEEIIPDGETGDEVISEPEVPVIEDVSIIEEAPADEAPTVEEQPANEEQPVITPPENNSGAEVAPVDNGSGGDTGGSTTDAPSSDAGSSGDSVSVAPSE